MVVPPKPWVSPEKGANLVIPCKCIIMYDIPVSARDNTQSPMHVLSFFYLKLIS